MTSKVAPADEWAGAVLRSLRMKQGLTQDQLAALAEIDRSRYNALENGRQSITETYAARLAPHLGVEPSLLLPIQPVVQAEASPLDRLVAIEARLDEIDESRNVFGEELLERLARLEEALVKLEPRPSQRSSDEAGQ